jgi:hypothetical protein
MKRSEKTGWPRVLGLAVAGWLATSCGPVADQWRAGGMAAAAKDQIMLVRKEPPSFGYQRLEMDTRAYPDMAVLVAKRGLPDFLAETDNGEWRYFILYYLKERHAYACRTHGGNKRTLEFAGPYPITDGEFRLLDGFRRDPSRQPGNL